MPHLTLMQGLAGGSFLKGILDQQSAQRAAEAAQQGQSALTARGVALYDQQLKAAMDAIKNLNYGEALKERQDVLQRQAATEMKNLAQAGRVAGYRPSDTPNVNAMTASNLKYLQNLADQQAALKLQYNALPLQYLGMVNTGTLSPAIGAQNQQMQYAQQQAAASNPFGGLIGLSPYLFPQSGGTK